MGLLQVSWGNEMGVEPTTVQMGGEGTGIPAMEIIYDPSGLNATKILPNIPGNLTIKPGIGSIELEYENRKGLELTLEVDDEKLYGSCKVSY